MSTVAPISRTAPMTTATTTLIISGDEVRFNAHVCQRVAKSLSRQLARLEKRLRAEMVSAMQAAEEGEWGEWRERRRKGHAAATAALGEEEDGNGGSLTSSCSSSLDDSSSNASSLSFSSSSAGDSSCSGGSDGEEEEGRGGMDGAEDDEEGGTAMGKAFRRRHTRRRGQQRDGEEGRGWTSKGAGSGDGSADADGDGGDPYAGDEEVAALRRALAEEVLLLEEELTVAGETRRSSVVGHLATPAHSNAAHLELPSTLSTPSPTSSLPLLSQARISAIVGGIPNTVWSRYGSGKYYPSSTTTTAAAALAGAAASAASSSSSSSCAAAGGRGGSEKKSGGDDVADGNVSSSSPPHMATAQHGNNSSGAATRWSSAAHGGRGGGGYAKGTAASSSSVVGSSSGGGGAAGRPAASVVKSKHQPSSEENGGKNTITSSVADSKSSGMSSAVDGPFAASSSAAAAADLFVVHDAVKFPLPPELMGMMGGGGGGSGFGISFSAAGGGGGDGQQHNLNLNSPTPSSIFDPQFQHNNNGLYSTMFTSPFANHYPLSHPHHYPHGSGIGGDGSSHSGGSGAVFINPADLIPFFSFRERSEDSVRIADGVELLVKTLRQQRSEIMMSNLLAGSSAAAAAAAGGYNTTNNASSSSSVPSSSGASASSPSPSLSPHALRLEKLKQLKEWERLIADAEQTLDLIAEETLEHEEARAAMLRVANAEQRAAESALEEINTQLRAAEPYCDFLSQQVLDTLRAMNAERFNAEKWEAQQQHIRPTDLLLKYTQHIANRHADASTEAADPALSASYYSTLQLLKAMDTRDGVISKELSAVWRLAKAGAHCEDVLVKLIKCQRCGRGWGRGTRGVSPDADADRRADDGSGAEEEEDEDGGGGRKSPRHDHHHRHHSRRGRRGEGGVGSSETPRVSATATEFYTLLPCGHDYCASCVRRKDKYYPEEDGPRQCAVCGELSLLPPVLNVALTAVAQRVRFQQVGARALDDAAEQFRAAMSLGAE